MTGKISIERVRALFEYDSASGRLLWKVKLGGGSKAPAGSKAGCVSSQGYFVIRVDKVLYKASHLVWLLHHGSLPCAALERINGDKLDDRVENLRLSSGGRKKPRRSRNGKRPGITSRYLRSVVRYEPETGIFRWVDDVGKHRHIKAGSVAGTMDAQGYRRISIDNYPFRCSWLAYLYMNGRWPKEEIDHINNDQSDDRWCNLRVATSPENRQNRRVGKNNTSGVKGVFIDKTRPGKFRAVIDVNGKRHYLGTFDSLSDAATARREAAESMHGAFARHE